MARERTLEDVIMYFIQAVAQPLTWADYSALGVPRFNLIRRMRFPNVFRALLICLVYRSLPLAFPQYSQELRKTMEEIFNKTYAGYEVDGENTAEMVKGYNELVDMSASRPFFELANHVMATQRRLLAKTEQAGQAEKLNQRLEQIFGNFSTLSEDVQIVEQKKR